jgi:flagellar biogenesis protein FliO
MSSNAEATDPVESAKTEPAKNTFNQLPQAESVPQPIEKNVQPQDAIEKPAPEKSTNESKSSTPIPFKQSQQNIGEQFSSIMLTLGLLCLLAVAVLLFLKKYMVKTGKIPKVVGEHIKVIDVQRLSPRTQLFLLEIDNVAILITENGDSSQAIHVKPSAANRSVAS